MKTIRSTKCSIRFATDKKKEVLNDILSEYSRVVNIFIWHFWEIYDIKINKTSILKPVVDIPKDSWLSARMRKVCAREALDMVSSVMRVFKWNKQQKTDRIKTLEKKVSKMTADTRENRKKINQWNRAIKMHKLELQTLQPHMPFHIGNRMSVSSTIANLNESKISTEFNAWLHLASIGRKISLDIPIRYHKHFNELAWGSRRMNSYIITNKDVQFCFEKETGTKLTGKKAIGIDTGINTLAALSTGVKLGTDIKQCIQRIQRCKHGSKGQKTARRALRQRIDEVARDVIQTEKPDVVVVENLEGICNGTKLKGRMSLTSRSSIGSWNVRYWFRRLGTQCEDNRVGFRTVNPFRTSITCPECGHADRMNRDGEVFLCTACGHADNADINASRNILARFISGPYGAAYKPENNNNNQTIGKYVQV